MTYTLPQLISELEKKRDALEQKIKVLKGAQAVIDIEGANVDSIVDMTMTSSEIKIPQVDGVMTHIHDFPPLTNSTPIHSSDLQHAPREIVDRGGGKLPIGKITQEKVRMPDGSLQMAMVETI